jgi:hypothetical protein
MELLALEAIARWSAGSEYPVPCMAVREKRRKTDKILIIEAS